MLHLTNVLPIAFLPTSIITNILLGLVVMERDSDSKGRGFDPLHCILGGHFSHIFVVKIVLFV